MASQCHNATDHTPARGSIFRGYPNEISPFVAEVITPPLVLFKSIQFLQKQCFDPRFYQLQLFCVSNFLIPQHFVFHLGPAVVFQRLPAICVRSFLLHASACKNISFPLTLREQFAKFGR